MVAAPEGQLEAYDFEYVAHTDADTLASYDADNHVYTMMPLYKVLSLTSVSMGRTLAGKHGITNVRRIRLPELKARASVHSCYKCNLLYTVFKLVPSKETARLTKRKRKQKQIKRPSTEEDESITDRLCRQDLHTRRLPFRQPLLPINLYAI